MKKNQLWAAMMMTAVILYGCGNGRDTIQPGSPQWQSLHDTTGSDIRSGKHVVIHVPASMYKPGVGGAPPPNVTIVPDPGK